jgi:hypothetical protein
LPAAVATQLFGGKIFDNLGDLLKLNEYVILPGKGGTIGKGVFAEDIGTKLKTQP